MNPLTNVRNITKLNENDLKNGIFDHNLSWHSQYKDSAYIFVGGLPYDLTEGDVLCVFSQYGEIVNINLVRDKKTGKSQGYGFICYEDQRSTILAVDNLNAIKLDGRTIRVDHVAEYRTPKSDEKGDDGKYKDKVETGCAPKAPSIPQPDDDDIKAERKKKKKEKKEKKKKKKKKIKDEPYGESGDDEVNNKLLQDKHTVSVKVEHSEDPSMNDRVAKLEKKDTRKKVESQWDRTEGRKSPKLYKRDTSPSRKRKRSRSWSRDRSPAISRRRSRSRSEERYSRR